MRVEKGDEDWTRGEIGPLGEVTQPRSLAALDLRLLLLASSFSRLPPPASTATQVNDESETRKPSEGLRGRKDEEPPPSSSC